MLNTWTFCFLICVIMPSPTLNAAMEPKDNESEKTMYEAVVQKCPQLAKTQLQKNLEDIFTKKCVDWPKINATPSAPSKEERSHDACLVLYESLLLFCANFGDRNISTYNGLIPTPAKLSNYTVDTICLSSKFKESLNKTEHNITQFLEPTKCLFMCAGFGDNGLLVKEDACKLAFYFATFDVKKLISDADKYRQSNNKLNAAAGGTQPEAPKFDVDIKPANAVNSKPQHTSIDEQNAVPVMVPSPIQSASGGIEQAKDSKKKSDSQAAKGEQFSPIENVPVQDQSDPLKSGGDSPEEVKGKSAKNETKEAPEPPKKEPVAPVNPPPEANDDDDISNLKGDENVPLGPDQEGFQDEGEDDAAIDNEVAKNTEGKGTINKSSNKEKPSSTVQDTFTGYNGTENMDGDSYVFSYFVVFMCIFIIGYVGYHNRQKIFALLLEGKRGKRPGRPGRRPNSANYHKLDSNLEEAVSSSCTKNASNVIY